MEMMQKTCGLESSWLVKLDETNSEITLFNKITRVKIKLPRFSSSPVVHKAMLLSAPDRNLDNYTVVVIYGVEKELAYYKPGKRTWALLKGAGCYYDDVIVHEEELYAVDEYGRVVQCQVDCFPRVIEITEGWFFWGQKVYLVSLEGEMCMVIRFLKDETDPCGETSRFRVCLENSRHEWDIISGLEDWIILVGHKHAVGLPLCTIRGATRDCIYYKDDYGKDRTDNTSSDNNIHVYNMDDNSIEQLSCCPPDVRRAWQQHIDIQY